jgi:hypothetical protein
MEIRERIILNYIEGYNSFDSQKMVKDFSENIIFENIQDGKVTMKLKGFQEFLSQAEAAKNYFSKRKQTIISIDHQSDYSETLIDYHAVLACDLPNGLKKGEELRLKGKSRFHFQDGKILKLIDES